jgi:hypothetical protein
MIVLKRVAAAVPAGVAVVVLTAPAALAAGGGAGAGGVGEGGVAKIVGDVALCALVASLAGLVISVARYLVAVYQRANRNGREVP